MKIEMVMELHVTEEQLQAITKDTPKLSGMRALENLFISHAISLSKCCGRAMDTKIVCDNQRSESGYGTTGFCDLNEYEEDLPSNWEVSWIPY